MAKEDRRTQKMYIKRLAGLLQWEEEHLDNFVHKYYHKDSLDTLIRQEATKVIEGLKYIEKKHAQSPGAGQ